MYNIKGINSDSPFSIPFMNASEKGTSVGNKIKLGEGNISFGLFDGQSVENKIETRHREIRNENKLKSFA